MVKKKDNAAHLLDQKINAKLKRRVLMTHPEARNIEEDPFLAHNSGVM